MLGTEGASALANSSVAWGGVAICVCPAPQHKRCGHPQYGGLRTRPPCRRCRPRLARAMPEILCRGYELLRETSENFRRKTQCFPHFCCGGRKLALHAVPSPPRSELADLADWLSPNPSLSTACGGSRIFTHRQKYCFNFRQPLAELSWEQRRAPASLSMP